MAKLTIKSKRTKQLKDRIEKEVATRPTRRVRQLVSYYEVWTDGLSGKVPKVFQELVEELDSQEDPEYSEYVRLKTKFEE